VPGGAWVVPLAREWTAFVGDLDHDVKRADPGSGGRLRGVRPVDDDPGGRLLRAAIAEHERNASVTNGLEQIVFRDDRPSGWDQSMDEFNVYAHKAAIERSRVPIYGWGGWLDGATADGAIARFLTFSNRQRVVIGPWNHGATADVSPFQPDATSVDPPLDTQSFEALCFFDRHVRGRPSSMADGVIIYYTMGEERWKETRVWPPANATSERWYLHAGHRLRPIAPSVATGRDRYSVDFTATTGGQSRWITGLDRRDVVYGDRTTADARLLVYDGAPLEQDVEITGNPVVSLELASTASDGLVIAYLEDLDPSGRVRYLTEGVLRVIHRRISPDPPPYRLPIPYHSFRRRDAEPLVPGEIATVRFGLFATSVRIPRGHRLRLAIAGADRDNFPRIPADRTPVLSIERNQTHPSFIELPVITPSRATQGAARSRVRR
jgi:putative CocE/NonD family hydrolase